MHSLNVCYPPQPIGCRAMSLAVTQNHGDSRKSRLTNKITVKVTVIVNTTIRDYLTTQINVTISVQIMPTSASLVSCSDISVPGVSGSSWRKIGLQFARYCSFGWPCSLQSFATATSSYIGILVQGFGGDFTTINKTINKNFWFIRFASINKFIIKYHEIWTVT